MTSQTLFTLVDSIQVSRIRLNNYNFTDQANVPWSPQQEKLLFNLILQYGADLSLIHNFFPTRSRKQLKRKHKDMSKVKAKLFKRIEQRRVRENRKSYFDEEIFTNKLIKWNSKPNNSGSSSSSEEN